MLYSEPMHYMGMPAAALGLLLFLSPLKADTLTGIVVKVKDGDTVDVLDDARTKHNVRLLGIDAPEKKQDFGNTSREHLASLVAGKKVQVEFKKKDRYGRILGKLTIDGKDANVEQIRAGFAWHYKQYARDQQATDRLLYADAEAKARGAKKGLWQNPTALAPWEFRSRQRALSRKKKHKKARLAN